MLPGLLAFVVITSAHLTGQVVAPEGVLTDISQVLIVPTLVWVLLAGTPTPKSRLVRLVLVALVLSWLGDSLPRLAPDGSTVGLALMIVPFFLAQLVYIAAFLPFARRSVVRDTPILAGYVVVWLLVVGIFTAGDGGILPAVVYGGVLVTMAVLATGIDLLAAVGGVLFVISDTLVGLGTFLAVGLPVHGLWVMLTYALAQALLVLAVAHADRRAAPERHRHREPEHPGRDVRA